LPGDFIAISLLNLGDFIAILFAVWPIVTCRGKNYPKRKL
jgi:hypothetical protein